MTIKHKCKRKIVYNEAVTKIEEHSSYDEHVAMHYGTDGWDRWASILFIVEKCKHC